MSRAFDKIAKGLKDAIGFAEGDTSRGRVVNRGRKAEPEGQSALPRFNRYSIPEPRDPKAVDCPYCVKRPRNLQAHCRAQHPDKPEAR